MAGIEVKYEVLNQRTTPAFYASSLATRPTFGFPGRIFIDSDSPSTGIYRDTGSAWVQVADQGAGTTGTLQTVTTNGNTSNTGLSITGNGIGIGTTIPGSNRLDIHASSGIQATFNGTGVTNAGLQLQSAGVGKWTLQNNYNTGSNDFVITDVLNTVNRLTIDSATGTSTFRKRLRVVELTDNPGLQCYDATQGYFLGYYPSATNKEFVINYDSAYNSAARNLLTIYPNGQFFVPNLSSTGIVTNASSGLLQTSAGTGFLKMSSGTISYDNTSYLPLSAGASFPLTNTLYGTGAIFSAGVTINTSIAGLILNRPSTSTYNGISLQTATAAKWFIGLRENLASNNYIIYNEVTALDVVTINSGTNTATFAGSVNIANSVAASIAAPSTHKVSILINGVQYYLLASNV